MSSYAGFVSLRPGSSVGSMAGLGTRSGGREGRKGSVREREKMLTMCEWEGVSYKEFLGGICCAGCGT